MSAEILAYLKRIEAKVDALAKTDNGPGAGGMIADDADLDSSYGDPKVRFTPRGWNDGDFKGHSFSNCPPAFLELMAKALDYFASQKQAENPKKAGYDRLDAARARGWCRRLRAGWKAPTSRLAEAPAGGNYDFDDSGEAEAEVHHSQFDDF